MSRSFHYLFFLLLLTATPLPAAPYPPTPACFSEEIDNEYAEINYLKMGGGAMTLNQDSSYLPLLGFGRRYECPEMGIDYSATFGYVKGIAGKERSLFVYTFPKILALKYLDPHSNFSFYFGGGASWSGIVDNNKRQTFHGVFLEAALGFELQRKGSVRTFLQLDLSQGILAAYRRGSFPTPSLQLTFGVGF